MSLKHAILGFLTLAPMTGYELKTQYFDGSVANFWSADQSQIYRTLDKMEADGWVESSWHEQENRPNRKTYTILPKGYDGLKAWLAESKKLDIERRPFLVKIYFARHLEKHELLALLRDQLAQHQERLHFYQMLPFPESAEPVMIEQLRFGRYTLEYGLRYEQMQIEWLEFVINDIEQ